MRIPPSFAAATLCAVFACAVHAQTTNNARPRTVPGGMNFSYDAQHDQINATGVQFKPAVVSSPTIAPTTGTITVTINIKTVSHFGRGTAIHCSLMAIGGQIDLDTGAVNGGLETANGIAMGSSGGSTSCTLTIPYSWALPAGSGADSGLILVFGASAVRAHDFGGSTNDVLRSTLQLDGIENLPSNGASSSYTFDVAL